MALAGSVAGLVQRGYEFCAGAKNTDLLLIDSVEQAQTIASKR